MTKAGVGCPALSRLQALSRITVSPVRSTINFGSVPQLCWSCSEDAYVRSLVSGVWDDKLSNG